MPISEFQNLPNSWQIKTLGEVLNYEQPTKYIVKSTKYNDSYKTPVLTAGKSFILGYTDELKGIFTQIPVIIFDDFTTDTKFVDFKFKVKSSAMKILHSKENADIKFIYYFMQTIRHRSDTHKRYWISEYAKIKIPLPPLEIQKRIVARLESAFEKIEKGSAHLQDAKTKLAKYKQSLLKSAFNGTLTAAASLQGVEKAETIHTAPSLRGSAADEAIHKVDCHKSANANFHNDDKSVDCHDLTSSKLAMTDKENPKLPQGWTIKTLGEIYDITSSKRVFKDEWKTDGIPFYRARDLVSFLKNEPIKNPLFISETMYNEYSNKYGIPLEDDILVTGVGTIGIPYLVKANEKFYFKDGNILWFKKRASNIFSKYVYYLFLSNLLDTNSKGSTVLTYTIINAKNTKIPLPPLETQKQIVKLLEKHLQHADKTGEFIESALNKAKQLKQSLLKSAFLGKPT